MRLRLLRRRLTLSAPRVVVRSALPWPLRWALVAVVLGGIAWLMREESAPTMKPPVEVLPTVALTNSQMRWVFLLTVIGMPGGIALAGVAAWWLRR